ncbi:alpha-ketoglutarate-dependent dioxygenase AlkB family protein [Amphritea sp. HPY]|uniref:alpha-ketoglutarate-dependent dioxygenase AlkB family protein n=1 Tax=Amphritea sp. HPY TaxID=3421652 RepID=UPI003D7C8915
MKQQIKISDGELILIPDFLPEQESDSLYQQLQQEIHWRQDDIFLFGRQVKIPRMQAFQGEPGIQYRYSGLSMKTEPWHPRVLAIKQRLENLSGSHFNSVLLNYYRNGRDSMGWHSDDEPELGSNPVIASLSLGDTRRFLLRHRYDKSIPQQELLLNNGSVLIMAGKLQHNWQHSVPKTAKAMQGRINLTFRLTRN